MGNRLWVSGGAILSLVVLCGLLGAGTWASGSAELTDGELETVLRRGKITRKEDIGEGVTLPKRLWIELDGVAVSASFKDVDIQKRGMTRFASGNAELNFTDSYKYERAAYLLDRELGLGMVPVTVIRTIRRRPGAATLWVDNSVSNADRIEQGLRPPDMVKLFYQQSDMRIFDALIYNTDRHSQNQLFTLKDWQLHLIDHSRAFRTALDLPESFAHRPTTISRSLLAKIEALNGEQLKRLLKRELGPTQINSLLVRRDLMLEKLERDRLEYGDDYFFREEKPLP